MKMIPVALLFSALALPLHAEVTQSTQHAAPPVAVRLEPDPDRLPRLMRQLRAARQAEKGRVHTNAIIGSRTTRAILFPAAGSVRAAGGEFFRTEITLDASGDVGVFFLPRGGTGDTPAFRVRGVGDFGYPLTYRDFVGETLGLTGQLGALLMIPLNENDELDDFGVIDGFARIWTEQPGQTGGGTVSQQFQAVDPFAFDYYWDTKALGLQHNPQYRTNWGIVNLEDVPLTFRVFPTSLLNNGTQPVTVTVPPFSLAQQGLSGDFGPNGVTVYIRLLTEFDQTPPLFVAFASSTDNRTGDGWVVLSSADWEEEDFPN